MSVFNSYLALTKPRVVVLLQITALCSVLVHDLFGDSIGLSTGETMGIVFVGGYLTAGGANAVNMWYDRDIDPLMSRTSSRPIPRGDVSPAEALSFGVLLSLAGIIWFLILSNEVAAFWALFSILFYVFIYSFWLKRSTVQNIVIGGIAGSTPPVIGWAVAESNLSINFESISSFLLSLFDLGSSVPWMMFLLIFLWTPPHFWALALFRSEEYEKVGVPMMPGIKGTERTISEMKIYSILLILLSLIFPFSYGLEYTSEEFYFLGGFALFFSFLYAKTVWGIDINEDLDEKGAIPSALHSFLFSMKYLAIIFFLLVAISAETIGMILFFVGVSIMFFNENGYLSFENE